MTWEAMGMIHWLDTVGFDNLCGAMVLALIATEDEFRRAFGPQYDMMITSCNDGQHAGKPVAGDTVDPHYVGKAADIRIKGTDNAMRPAFISNLRGRLGPRFVVLHEDEGGPNEHVHIQYGHVAAG